MNSSTQPTLGFIGQGFVGKSYANSFEDRGFSVTRYSQEEPYIKNKDVVGACDIVFIAVPTPTTPAGVDDSIIQEVLTLLSPNVTAVIKSTVLPGTTESLQRTYPHLRILHNPEFLRENDARYDVDHPTRTIIGMGNDTPEHRTEAKRILAILPKAPFELITDAKTAEFIKYTHNTVGYSLVIFMNLLYDLASSYGISWDPIKESVLTNPWIPGKYVEPVHKGGRGAGGACFIKDFAAFREIYTQQVGNLEGEALLRAFEDKNIQLLTSSGKNIDLLRSVYGEERISSPKS